MTDINCFTDICRHSGHFFRIWPRSFPCAPLRLCTAPLCQVAVPTPSAVSPPPALFFPSEQTPAVRSSAAPRVAVQAHPWKRLPQEREGRRDGVWCLLSSPCFRGCFSRCARRRAARTGRQQRQCSLLWRWAACGGGSGEAAQRARRRGRRMLCEKSSALVVIFSSPCACWL